VRQMAPTPGTVLLDARLPELYARGHIPERSTCRRALRGRPAALLPRLAFGRDGHRLLRRAGMPGRGRLGRQTFRRRIGDILVYREGLKDWQQRGYAVAR